MGIGITMAIESDDGHVAREKEVLRMDRGADSAIGGGVQMVQKVTVWYPGGSFVTY